MANFIPVLAGRPDFGGKARNAWLETLMLFLGDPFRPVNGQYNFTVPGEAITGSIDGSLITGQVPGSAIWRDNAFGIRELNEFSEFDTVSDGNQTGVSDRPGWLFVFNATDVVPALYVLSGTSFVNSTATVVFGSATYFVAAGSGGPGVAGKITVYHDGTGQWVVDNQMGYDVDLYMCVMSLGQQVTS